MEATLDLPSSDPVSDPLSDPVARLLRNLAEGIASSSELMVSLGLKHRASFREHALRCPLASWSRPCPTPPTAGTRSTA